MVQRNTAGLLLAVVAVVALSGCLTVGMGVDSTVASDGTIERYELRMNLSGQAYSMMAMASSMDGADGSDMGSLDDAEEDIRSNVTDEFESVGEVETNVTETDEYMAVTVVLHDAVPAEGGNISVSTEGDTVVYRDDTLNRTYGGPSASGFGDDGATDDGSMDGMGGMMDGMEDPELHLSYRLEMPGEIEDSNADEVEGSVATWNRTYVGEEIDGAGFTAEAESTTGGGLPGFGAVVAAVALLTVGLLGARRRRSG